eukprot:TRINITY_DN7514_c0_g1_i8.p2 TRINITY_DN7514_c0_g1~~TRINITY_DN7514_c0_g1_i8.p2  ORF type:complete len:292 (+),score=-24.26 TRINITY_DN7514_c0_g1_i8:44-877(+)
MSLKKGPLQADEHVIIRNTNPWKRCIMSGSFHVLKYDPNSYTYIQTAIYIFHTHIHSRCTYVYINVCIYASDKQLYVYMYIQMSIHIYACKFACMHTYVIQATLVRNIYKILYTCTQTGSCMYVHVKHIHYIYNMQVYQKHDMSYAKPRNYYTILVRQTITFSCAYVFRCLRVLLLWYLLTYYLFLLFFVIMGCQVSQCSTLFSFLYLFYFVMSTPSSMLYDVSLLYVVCMRWYFLFSNNFFFPLYLIKKGGGSCEQLWVRVFQIVYIAEFRESSNL